MGEILRITLVSESVSQKARERVTYTEATNLKIQYLIVKAYLCHTPERGSENHLVVRGCHVGVVAIILADVEGGLTTVLYYTAYKIQSGLESYNVFSVTNELNLNNKLQIVTYNFSVA